jgi:adenosylhomocysteinase
MNGMSAIQNGCLVVVTHFLQDRVPYLEALERLAPIRLLIPKQRSMQQQVYEQLSQKWTVIRHLDRQALAEPNGIDRVCEHIGSRRVVFLDVGGYFSAPLDTYCQRMPDQVIGIVEVTKNGYHRYANRQAMPVACVDISRSAIKEGEAYPVAVSVVASADAMLRDAGQTFLGKRVLVIGYGDIGKCLAGCLRRHVHVSVYDADPLKLYKAASRGFATPDLPTALSNADIIFCATGNQALPPGVLQFIRPDAFVFCATSSDDELGPETLASLVIEGKDGPYTICRTKWGRFMLAHGGLAVNFAHGAEIRPILRAVQAETLLGVDLVTRTPKDAGIVQISEDAQRALAKIYLDHYAKS